MAAPKGHPPYAGGGRPAEYNEESLAPLAESLLCYMENCRTQNKFFWWKDWCFDNGFSPQACTKFAKLSTKFREAYELVVDYQETFVTKGALVKKLDSNFSKFYLTNRYKQNWRESGGELNISDMNNEQFQSLMSQLSALQSQKAQPKAQEETESHNVLSES